MNKYVLITRFFLCVFLNVYGLVNSSKTQGQIITTVAGRYSPMGYYYGDGRAATSANLNQPEGLSVDKHGNLFIADSYNHVVRKVSTSGIITTFAGIDSSGYSGDGGPATNARLYHPTGIAFDSSGNVYISDKVNNCIRIVDTSGTIRTFAGNPTATSPGDGGPASAAAINIPQSICFDRSGNLYICEPTGCIRKISSSGIITTIGGIFGYHGFSGDGGPATAAELDNPIGLTVDSIGNVYVADQGAHCVRKINTSGIINTVAGIGGSPGFSGDGGAATSANLRSPDGIAIDRDGNLYISDFGNERIRKVSSSGIISSYAGNGYFGYSGDGRLPTLAQISGPVGITTDLFNNVYFADYSNNCIRKIDTCRSSHLPPITGATSSICLGSSITLSDSSSGGTWSVSDDTSVATITSSGIFTARSAVTWFVGEIVYYSLNNHCSSTMRSIATIAIDTNLHAGTIIGATNLCVGSLTIMSDTTSSISGTWSSSSSGIASINSTGTVFGISGGSAIITYTNANSCGTVITTDTINVIAIPNAGTISGTTTFCQGTTSTLSSSGATGGTWSSSSPGVATVSSSGIVTGVSGGTAVISYTVTNVCGSTSATATITINPLANPGTISGSSLVCLGDTIMLADAAIGGTWSSSSTSLATVSSSGIVRSVAVGGVTISYSVTNGCGTRSAIHNVTVSTVPATGTVTGTDTICSGASTSLSGSPSGGTWGSASTHATVNSTGRVVGISTGTATISYTFTNACGSASALFSMTINTVPNAGPLTGTTAICPGSPSTLTPGVANGTWSCSNPSVASVDTSGIVHGISVGTSIITYIATNICGIDTAFQTITVNPLPDAGTITGPDIVCPGATVTLADAVSSGVWGSSNTTIASISSSGIVTGVTTGSATISYSYTNSCGTATATYSFSILSSASCPSEVKSLQLLAGGLQIFPNPNKGFFAIKLISPISDGAQVIITNVLGQKVKEFALPANNDIMVSLNIPGIYFITAITRNERFIDKVVIE